MKLNTHLTFVRRFSVTHICTSWIDEIKHYIFFCQAGLLASNFLGNVVPSFVANPKSLNDYLLLAWRGSASQSSDGLGVENRAAIVCSYKGGGGDWHQPAQRRCSRISLTFR